MAEVHVFGRVTNDLQLKMSHRQVPYVSFGLVEWIGRRDTGHRQYFEVWAWGTAALSLGRCGDPQGFPHLGPRLFGTGGLHQKRWKRKGQAAEAQPDGMADKASPYSAEPRTKAKPRRCPAAAASCGGRGRRSGTPAGISVFRQSGKRGTASCVLRDSGHIRGSSFFVF